MTSAISSITAAIALWAPTYNSDVTIYCRDMDELSDVFDPGDCPVRMLFVGEPDAAMVALGKTVKANWKIVDRCFIKPAAQGDSLKENSQRIRDYIASYINIVRQNRAPTSQSWVTDVSLRPVILNWPLDSEQSAMVGVEVTLAISEVF